MKNPVKYVFLSVKGDDVVHIELDRQKAFNIIVTLQSMLSNDKVNKIELPIYGSLTELRKV